MRKTRDVMEGPSLQLPREENARTTVNPRIWLAAMHKPTPREYFRVTEQYFRVTGQYFRVTGQYYRVTGQYYREAGQIKVPAGNHLASWGGRFWGGTHCARLAKANCARKRVAV
jgi:hypothetical protein